MKVEKEGNTTRYLLGLVILVILLVGVYYGFTMM
ncbi:hypothetical protein BN996_03085 [Haloferax massiliensis]|uniref:Uncharacterized protein n=1 Tax=Haloferax massiliensis TaxID=1476858 RepID=A0A0D6JUN4_9EURY|nr:hypothetical protein BN996_03085 [Haloferax massiliensis]